MYRNLPTWRFSRTSPSRHDRHHPQIYSPCYILAASHFLLYIRTPRTLTNSHMITAETYHAQHEILAAQQLCNL